MPKIFLWIAGAALAVAIGIFGTIAYYSQQIPQVAAAAQTAWANVENEFRRRAELTPSIIEIVASINETQGPLIGELKAKQAAILALAPNPDIPKNPDSFRIFMQTQDALSQKLGLVYDFLKYYPDRFHDEKIHATLGALEQQEAAIVAARNRYSGLAGNLNRMLSTPPQSWIAARLNPKPQKLIASFEQ